MRPDFCVSMKVKHSLYAASSIDMAAHRGPTSGGKLNFWAPHDLPSRAVYVNMLRRATLLLPALVRAAPLKRPFSGAASPTLADASPYWHEISRATDIETLPTPSLIVLMDRVRANVHAVISAAGGDPTRWRPHLKTTKLRPVWRELLNAGVRS